jgi:hypothetical protein
MPLLDGGPRLIDKTIQWGSKIRTPKSGPFCNPNHFDVSYSNGSDFEPYGSKSKHSVSDFKPWFGFWAIWLEIQTFRIRTTRGHSKSELVRISDDHCIYWRYIVCTSQFQYINWWTIGCFKRWSTPKVASALFIVARSRLLNDLVTLRII